MEIFKLKVDQELHNKLNLVTLMFQVFYSGKYLVLEVSQKELTDFMRRQNYTLIKDSIS
jgi:hypothetical protein